MEFETKKNFRQRLAQMKQEMSLFSSKKKNKEKDPFYYGEKVDEIYNHVTYIGSLCEQLIDLRKYKKELKKDIDELEGKRQIYQEYAQLPEGDKEKVENLWASLQGAERERQILKHGFSDLPTINPKLQKYEAEIPMLLEDMRIMEEEQRKTKLDLDYLEGEKVALQLSKERLQQAGRGHPVDD